MTDSGPPRDRILVTICDQTAFVHVHGRGSFQVGTALKRFGAAAYEAGCERVVFDLAACTSLDSTFMGILAGFAFRFQRRAGGEVIVVNLSPRVQELLTTLGLDEVLHTFACGSTPAEYQQVLDACGGLEVLDTPEESRRTTAETMVEAHESLVELSAENRPKFKDVLAYLREDLKKATHDDLPAE